MISFVHLSQGFPSSFLGGRTLSLQRQSLFQNSVSNAYYKREHLRLNWGSWCPVTRPLDTRVIPDASPRCMERVVRKPHTEGNNKDDNLSTPHAPRGYLSGQPHLYNASVRFSSPSTFAPHYQLRGGQGRAYHPQSADEKIKAKWS